MSFQYTGSYMVPGQTAEMRTIENTFWVDRYERQIWESVMLSGAARDAGNTNTTTLLRPGLLLGKIAATNKLVEWTPGAIDGSQYIFGILSINQAAQRLGSNQDRWLGQVMVGGALKASRLLIPGQSSFGIVGNALEHLVRAQLYGRFLFDDAWHGNAFGGLRGVVAVTADKTITEAENGTLFTNRGAAGAVNFTLPAVPKNGLRYLFYCVADQTLKVTAGTADTLVTFNDGTADSVSYETAGDKIGGCFEIIGDGTGWLVIPHNFADGVMVQTLTIAS